MSIEIKIPSPGESITQVQLAKWLVSEGEEVEKDQEVAEIDSDKASFPIAAPVSGRISLKAAEGDTLDVGAVLAVIQEGAVAPKAGLKSTPVETPAPESKTESKATNFEATPLAKKIIEQKNVNVQELKAEFPGKKSVKEGHEEDFHPIGSHEKSNATEEGDKKDETELFTLQGPDKKPDGRDKEEEIC